MIEFLYFDSNKYNHTYSNTNISTFTRILRFRNNDKTEKYILRGQKR